MWPNSQFPFFVQWDKQFQLDSPRPVTYISKCGDYGIVKGIAGYHGWPIGEIFEF